MPDESIQQFDPARDGNDLPSRIISCDKVSMQEEGRVLTLFLSSKTTLNEQEIGRILIVSGKCHSQGKRCILRCSKLVAEQLTALGLHRILWLE